MAKLRTRNAALLAKVETTPGEFVAPSASTDGILVEGVTPSFRPQNTETDEVTGSLDGRGPIPGGLQCELSFSLYLKGSGTPGVAPEFAELLRACGLAETVTLNTITGTTLSVTGGNTIEDSGSGLAALTVGTVIHASGFANAANNGEFVVTSSAAGSVGLAKVGGAAAGMTNETAGATVTLRYGIAGAAATAGSTTAATLQSPFAATAGLYTGMPVLLSGNPAASRYAALAGYSAGRVLTLTDLMGSALDTDTKASIPANVRYVPASSSIPALSIEYYLDGLRWRLAGCKGSLSVEARSAGPWRANIRLAGMLVSKDDAAVPAVTYDGTRPGTFRNSAMLMNRIPVSMETLSLDASMEMPFPPNPNQAEGFDPPEHVRRNLRGRIDPHLALVATRDVFAAFRAGTEEIIHARLLGGTAANPGQRVGLTIPSAFYEGANPVDKQGLAAEDVGFFCRGQDAGAFLVFY
mgnify:CR=1 FL=1